MIVLPGPDNFIQMYKRAIAIKYGFLFITLTPKSILVMMPSSKIRDMEALVNLPHILFWISHK